MLERLELGEEAVARHQICDLGWKTMKKTLLVVFLALSAIAFAKPAHVLYHAGKNVVYPMRHPQKTAHGLWKIITAVF